MRDIHEKRPAGAVSVRPVRHMAGVTSKDRVRLLEIMVLSLTVLLVIGVMLTAFTAVLFREQDTARHSTARALYMAAEDYTARQLNAGVHVQDLQGADEQSAFLKNLCFRAD